MAYSIEKCKCGVDDWDLIAKRFECKSCSNKTVVLKFDEDRHDPIDSVCITKKESKSIKKKSKKLPK